MGEMEVEEDVEVKSEPMELTDSPMEELTEAGQHVFPVRGEGHSLHGFISRELGPAGESAGMARFAEWDSGALESAGNPFP